MSCKKGLILGSGFGRYRLTNGPVCCPFDLSIFSC